MTRNEIIEMATQVGLCYTLGNYEDWIDAGPAGIELEKFADLVVAHEREECAKLCDSEWSGDADAYDYSIASNECAAAIRARSKI